MTDSAALAAIEPTAPKQALRFLLVGGTCFVVNLLMLYRSNAWLHWHYLEGLAASSGIVVVLGWWMNRRWTFETTSTADPIGELRRYAAASLASFAINSVAMGVLVSWMGMHYLVASSLIAVVMTACNFLCHRLWTFRGHAVSGNN